jgi:hypothetical protein
MAIRPWLRRWWPLIAASIMVFNVALAMERQADILKKLKDIDDKIGHLAWRSENN